MELRVARRRVSLVALSGGLIERVSENELEAKPTPVNAVVPDLAALDVHNLNKIDLIAIRCLPRIFPSEDLPVCEEEPSSVPAEQVVGTSSEAFVEEVF